MLGRSEERDEGKAEGKGMRERQREKGLKVYI